MHLDPAKIIEINAYIISIIYYAQKHNTSASVNYDPVVCVVIHFVKTGNQDLILNPAKPPNADGFQQWHVAQSLPLASLGG